MGSLLYAFAVLAVLLMYGKKIQDVYYADRISIAELVADFNAEHATFYGDEPPHTEEEVIAAIKAHLPTLRAQEPMKEILSEAVRSELLPRGHDRTKLYLSPTQPAWWINLTVSPARWGNECTIRIRYPVATPKLNRKG
jgi:hypothetical protein